MPRRAFPGGEEAVKQTRASAIYALTVGLMMLAMWSFFIASAQVPELRNKPVEIAFHLTVEFSTAIALVVAGLAALRGRLWGAVLELFAFGMLIYTIMLSPGYYAQLGQMMFVLMFAVLFVLTVLFTLLAARGLIARVSPTSGQDFAGGGAG
jgi:hypothetical protein